MSASGANSYIALIKAATGNPSAIPTDPLLQKVNFESSDLGAKIKSNASKNMRGDRRTTDSVITGVDVGGGYSFEMTYENSLLDELIEGFLWNNWVTDVIKDGAVYIPFFIERGHTDISEYFQFMGMACNIWKMEYKDQAPVTGSYQFVGLDTKVIKTPTAGATYTDATTNPVFSTVTDIPEIKIDGVVQTGCHIKEWDITINNNVTPKTGPGKLGACSTNAHALDIGGKITMYFEDADMYRKLLAGTAFSFSWKLEDSLGNSYVMELPKCKLVTDEIPIDGPEDVFDNASYMVIYDATAGCMMKITRHKA